MHKRPKIAFYWCAGCGGCEESIIDIGDDLLSVAQHADIVLWPVALDARYRNLEALADGEIDATLINGAVRLDEHVRMVRLLREKSKCIIAHGTCAHLGGVVGLGNLSSPEALLTFAFRQAPGLDDPEGPLPGSDAAGRALDPPLPQLLPSVLPLGRVIAVDAVVPGCPPPAGTMSRVIGDVIDGRLPTTGTVYTSPKSLCHDCPRLASRPARITISRFKRLHETLWDPAVCFLPQGLICLGPVTRGGCNARCIAGNMPCRGCFGPTERLDDFGAGAMSLIASLMADGEDDELDAITRSIADPLGLFYRYSLATSVLGERPDR